jgi:hypothetical protein
MELYLRESFESMLTREGRVGVLLGIHAPWLELDWQLPSGLVRVITAKLLHPTELALVQKKGASGRLKLRELFANQGTYHLSSLKRKPVV